MRCADSLPLSVHCYRMGRIHKQSYRRWIIYALLIFHLSDYNNLMCFILIIVIIIDRKPQCFNLSFGFFVFGRLLTSRNRNHFLWVKFKNNNNNLSIFSTSCLLKSQLKLRCGCLLYRKSICWRAQNCKKKKSTCVNKHVITDTSIAWHDRIQAHTY